VSALLISIITFAFVFASAIFGMYLRNALPKGHLGDDVKDVVRLSAGLIGTIAALVLGLLIASAKSSYDARDTQIKQVTANFILLDSLLVQFGPDAHNLRVALRNVIPPLIERIWNEDNNSTSAPFVVSAEAQAFVDKIQELKADTAKQALQTRVLSTATDLAQSRLSLFSQSHDSIPRPFLAILIFWLAMIYASFGLFVRPGPIVHIAFFVGAVSVSAAIFLILEMDQPLAGLLQISSEPLRHALAPLAP
jgi:hypothetical protein